MDAIYQALKHTPIWVYILFGVLLARGLSATSEKKVPYEQIFILPSILFVLSLYSMFKNFNINNLSLLFWLGGTFFGTALGFLHFKSLKVKYNKESNSFIIPGTITTLLLILLIFASKYYFSYQIAIDPKLLEQKDFEFLMLSVTGCMSGCFIGRLAYCLRINK